MTDEQKEALKDAFRWLLVYLLAIFMVASLVSLAFLPKPIVHVVLLIMLGAVLVIIAVGLAKWLYSSFWE